MHGPQGLLQSFFPKKLLKKTQKQQTKMKKATSLRIGKPDDDCMTSWQQQQ